MSMQSRLAARVAELVSEGIPFVQATVVRAQCPTSARPGDSAVVLADGSIEGFVGGLCAEGSVRVAALPLLDQAEPLLLRILPDDSGSFPDADGAMTVVNPCLSGGAIEVFLEPKLPAPRIALVGSTPIADALAHFGEPLGFAMVRGDGAAAGVPAAAGCTAMLISSHGRNEEQAIRSALDAGVEFIGLVASAKRGAAVLASLDLTPAESKLVRSPVGIDIGAKTAEEIALSILAELVRALRAEGLRPAASDLVLPESAIDPVCGMAVVVAPDTAHARVNGADYWFCNPGCRARYVEEANVR